MKPNRPDRSVVPPDNPIDEELQHHLAERIDNLIASGMTPDEAEQHARQRFGDVRKWTHELEEIATSKTRSAHFANVFQDLRHTLRQFRRAPGFAALAVLTLGLGIGASTAMFGIVKAVVLDPLPYANADRLIELSEVTPDGLLFSVAEANFLDLQDRVSAFEHFAASQRADLAWMRNGEPLNLVAHQVTPSFFEVFEVQPFLGRPFAEDEGGASPAPVAVLSHALWRDNFAGQEPADASLILDGTPYTVVGVMPAEWGPLMDADLWIPLGVSITSNRGNHSLRAVGMLGGASSIEQAQAEATNVARTLGVEHPETNQDWGVQLVSLKEAVVGRDRIRGGWILLGAVGLLLILACGSVANLLIARASTRVREMSLRSALGAGHGRLVQQLLVEGVTLAALAAVVGVVLAYLGIPAIQAVSPADAPRIGDARVNGTVIAFAVTVSLVTGLIFGLAPAIGVRASGLSMLRSGGRVSGRRGEQLRRGMVACQIAATVTLLAGAGLLASSFLKMQSQDVGLRLAGTSAVPLMLSGDRYSDAERQIAIAEIRRALGAIPGVESVGSSNIRPFSGSSTAIDLAVEGVPSSPDEAPFVRWRLAGRGYFDAAGLPLLAGRLFAEADFGEEAESVVVVTIALAEHLFGDAESAIGQRVAMGWNGTNWRRVIGVIPNVEDRGVSESPPLTFFMPNNGGWPVVTFLVRNSSSETPPDARAVREAIWSVEPALPVPAVEPLATTRNASVAGPRFNTALMAVFGFVALILSVMGVYGVTMFSVSRRTPEIGVRMALGAQPGSVLTLLMKQGIGLALLGIGGGILLAFTLARYLEALLFQTGSYDLRSFAGACLVTLAAVLVATWLPALRATRIDPSSALSAD